MWCLTQLNNLHVAQNGQIQELYQFFNSEKAVYCFFEQVLQQQNSEIENPSCRVCAFMHFGVQCIFDKAVNG